MSRDILHDFKDDYSCHLFIPGDILPPKRYQKTTAISNNPTQLISISLPFRVSVYRLPGERTRHHPSFCSRPSSSGAFRSRCPVWATATTGRKTTPRPRSTTATDHSFLSSVGLPFFSGHSRRDHPVTATPYLRFGGLSLIQINGGDLSRGVQPAFRPGASPRDCVGAAGEGFCCSMLQVMKQNGTRAIRTLKRLRGLGC